MTDLRNAGPRLPRESIRALDAIAAENDGLNRSDLIREALSVYFGEERNQNLTIPDQQKQRYLDAIESAKDNGLL